MTLHKHLNALRFLNIEPDIVAFKRFEFVGTIYIMYCIQINECDVCAFLLFTLKIKVGTPMCCISF